jgi:hypothetical protein
VRRIVLHPSAFLAWFGPPDGGGSSRREFESGMLGIVVPPAFTTDVLAATAARGWTTDRMTRLAAQVERLGFESAAPSAAELAPWLARGFDPSQAAYAAVAAARELPVSTEDQSLEWDGLPTERP